MIDIRSVGGAGASPIPLPTDTSTTATGQGNAAAAAGTLNDVDINRLLGEMARMAAALPPSTSSGAPGMTDRNGAPVIDGVQIDFSPEDMAAALLVLQGKTQDAQLKTAREGIVTNQKRLEERNQQSMNKINEWIQNCKDAAEKEKAASVSSWISKILGFVAAAFAVVVAAVASVGSAGAASPLLGLAVIALVGATISLASQISQEYGGPELEISTWTAKLCSVVLEACGVPKEDAEAAGRMMSGMVGLLTFAVLVDPAYAGQAFGGFAELVGANADQIAIVTGVATAVATIAISIGMVAAAGPTGVGAAVDGVAKTVLTAGRIGQAVAGIGSGVAGATAGGYNIAKAGNERAANVAQADKKLIDAMIAKLQQQMENDREDIKKVMQEIMDGMNVVSQMINSAGESRSQIAANLTSVRSQTI